MKVFAVRGRLSARAYGQLATVAGITLVGSGMAWVLGTASRTAYWIIVVQTIAVAIVVIPDVFLGAYVGGIQLGLNYVPGGNDIRFMFLVPLAAAIAHLARRWPRLPRLAPNAVILSQVALWALFVWGLTYSDRPETGQDFLRVFTQYHIVLIAVPLAFHDHPASLRRISYAFGVSSVLIGLSSFLAVGQVWSGAIQLYSQVVAVDERMLGAGILFLVWLMAAPKNLGVWRVPVAVLCVLLFFSLVLLGRRGILIGTLLAALLCVVFAARLRLRGIATLVLIAAAIFFSYQVVPDRYRIKTFDAASYAGYWTSSQERVRIYNDGLARIENSPVWGHGTGSGSVPGLGSGVTSYMHNIFLEIAYQLGTVGVVVFGFFLLAIAYAVMRILADRVAGEERRNLGILLFCWFVIWFVPAQLSYDLVGNRNMWFVAGLIGALAGSPARIWQTTVGRANG